MSEKRFAMLAASAAGGSMMFTILGLFVLFSAVFIAAGEHEWFASPLVSWGVAWFVAYIASLYALATLPGKSRRRRLVSWSFSVAFHAAMVLYFAIALDWGTAALIFLAPEVAAGVLSGVGLSMAARAET